MSNRRMSEADAFTDPFAEADEDTGETKQSQNYIHIRIQRKFTPTFYLISMRYLCDM